MSRRPSRQPSHSVALVTQTVTRASHSAAFHLHAARISSHLRTASRPPARHPQTASHQASHEASHGASHGVYGPQTHIRTGFEPNGVGLRQLSRVLLAERAQRLLLGVMLAVLCAVLRTK